MATPRYWRPGGMDNLPHLADVLKMANSLAEVEAALGKKRIPYIVASKGRVVHIREAGKPAVDYYPKEGEWTALGRLRKGGLAAFLDWYKRA